MSTKQQCCPILNCPYNENKGFVGYCDQDGPVINSGNSDAQCHGRTIEDIMIMVQAYNCGEQT